MTVPDYSHETTDERTSRERWWAMTGEDQALEKMDRALRALDESEDHHRHVHTDCGFTVELPPARPLGLDDHGDTAPLATLNVERVRLWLIGRGYISTANVLTAIIEAEAAGVTLVPTPPDALTHTHDENVCRDCQRLWRMGYATCAEHPVPQDAPPPDALDVDRLAEAMDNANSNHGGYECCAPPTHANAAAIAREYAALAEKP